MQVSFLLPGNTCNTKKSRGIILFIDSKYFQILLIFTSYYALTEYTINPKAKSLILYSFNIVLLFLTHSFLFQI